MKCVLTTLLLSIGATNLAQNPEANSGAALEKGYLYRAENFKIKMTNFRQAHPSSDAVCGRRLKAHNNVDLVRFNGRYYMAYRTAPFHFPSNQSRINILSSEDGKHWQCEFGFCAGRDLREPRFLEFDGTLRLYFFQGGVSMWKFQPGQILCATLKEHWTDPVVVQPEMFDGYVPWRFRVKDGRAYMSAYQGTEMYRFKGGGKKCHVRLFVSEDGERWRPAAEKPEFDERWAEEGEIIFDDKGELWGTIRLEGKGGALVWTENGESKWKSKPLPRKYDSALLFNHGKNTFLVARRHLWGDGSFWRKARLLPEKMRHLYSMVHYWLATKRTSIYLIDKAKKDVVFLCDLPSRGDTAFAGIAPAGPNRYLVANYSNDVRGPDLPWLFGQVRATHIYTFELTIEE
jgi:hypothetical protein